MALSASEARRRLYQLIEQVNDDGTPVVINSRRRGSAVLVSEAEWNALEETAYLLRSPANAEHLLKSLRQVEVGQVVEVDLEYLRRLAADGER